ncbi:uncharacterized protein CMC5_017200 [Chondromyces crocatus]|uniref:Aminopeptidase n=2 Tax=Chondromyces crocatus TaxID=52 RepID=A0A0K1E9R4_CHOCO|nr:uncharacterized protein CMC5_017200 [Chondromyces crocatus]
MERRSEGSITDVAGVLVGHVTLDEGDVQTGVTAILPYPSSVRHRKLFVGDAATGEGISQTGIQVGEDFGVLSSPIVLCNATTVGIAYDALISRGHQRDTELPVDDAWPPVVIGLDDGYLNDQRKRRIAHDDVLRAVEQATDQAVPWGSVGIGRGLCALGGKGGVGGASRRVEVPGGGLTVGGLCAANGGRLQESPGEAGAEGAARGGAGQGGADTAARSLTPGFVLVMATDAPLLPEQLRLVAEAALQALARVVPASGLESRRVLAFSTANAIDGSLRKGSPSVYPARRLGDEALGRLLGATGDVARQALGRALVEATAVTGRRGRTLAPLDAKILTGLVGGTVPGGLTPRPLVE